MESDRSRGLQNEEERSQLPAWALLLRAIYSEGMTKEDAGSPKLPSDPQVYSDTLTQSN